MCRERIPKVIWLENLFITLSLESNNAKVQPLELYKSL